jgi:hypothetical protein
VDVRLLLAVAVALLAAAPARAQPPAPAAVPTTAVAALDRANAAYDYGDMSQVAESARLIVDGALPASPAQRLQALRLLGVGLYLTGRPTGAETAFLDLLRANHRAHLDATTTRPEVVAFFEDVRRRHAAEIQDAARVRSRHSMIWNFLPPLGQFKNGDRARGIAFLTLEAASFTAALGTHLVLDSWRQDAQTFPGHEDAARTLRMVNWISVGVLATTWVVGVTDAFLREDREPDEVARGPGRALPAIALHLAPGGLALSGRF